MLLSTDDPIQPRGFADSAAHAARPTQATGAPSRSGFEAAVADLTRDLGASLACYGVASQNHGRCRVLRSHLVGSADGAVLRAFESGLPLLIARSIRLQCALTAEARALARVDAGVLEAAGLATLQVVGLADLHGPAVAFFVLGYGQGAAPRDADSLALAAPGLHVAHGRLVSAERRQRLRREAPPITPCEGEVLHWIALGKTDKQIAVQLGKSVYTVKNQVRRVLEKYGVSKRAHVVALAEQSGVLGAFEPADV